MFDIATEARVALELLEKSGYKAYLVGGCVRDSLLGRPFNDYDITTNALPEQIKSVFSSYRVIETGIKHGTVTVLINSLPLEITTFRIDGEYADNRHPKNVVFSSDIADDLSRRDFTVNAIAYNGQTVDLFGGVEDLKNKVIRCVGDPDKRFNEDGLRIMRAIRFSSVLGFEIEDKTSKAIIKNKHLLKNISRERICVELLKLIKGLYAENVIKKYAEVFDEIFVGKNFAFKSSYSKTTDVEDAVALASFFAHDPYYIEDLKSLKLSRELFNDSCKIIKYFDFEIKSDKIYLKHFISEHGEKAYRQLSLLQKTQGADNKIADSVFENILLSGECCKISDLKINGDSLKKHGLKDKEIGAALKNILDAVIDEKVENKEDKLIEYLKENIL